jgi:hypothetical protein
LIQQAQQSPCVSSAQFHSLPLLLLLLLLTVAAAPTVIAGVWYGILFLSAVISCGKVLFDDQHDRQVNSLVKAGLTLEYSCRTATSIHTSAPLPPSNSIGGNSIVCSVESTSHPALPLMQPWMFRAVATDQQLQQKDPTAVSSVTASRHRMFLMTAQEQAAVDLTSGPQHWLQLPAHVWRHMQDTPAQLYEEAVATIKLWRWLLTVNGPQATAQQELAPAGAGNSSTVAVNSLASAVYTAYGTFSATHQLLMLRTGPSAVLKTEVLWIPPRLRPAPVTLPQSPLHLDLHPAVPTAAEAAIPASTAYTIWELLASRAVSTSTAAVPVGNTTCSVDDIPEPWASLMAEMDLPAAVLASENAVVLSAAIAASCLPYQQLILLEGDCGGPCPSADSTSWSGIYCVGWTPAVGGSCLPYQRLLAMHCGGLRPSAAANSEDSSHPGAPSPSKHPWVDAAAANLGPVEAAVRAGLETVSNTAAEGMKVSLACVHSCCRKPG